jgi:hypothetical protein
MPPPSTSCFRIQSKALLIGRALRLIVEACLARGLRPPLNRGHRRMLIRLSPLDPVRANELCHRAYKRLLSLVEKGAKRSNAREFPSRIWPISFSR